MSIKEKAIKRAFTLVELLVVIVIITIIAGITYPNYFKMREAALDKQAILGLRLIQGSQKVYRFKGDLFYPVDGSTETRISSINSALHLDLDETYFDINTSGGAGDFTATLTRIPAATGRTWTITKDSEPTCTCTGTCTVGCP